MPQLPPGLETAPLMYLDQKVWIALLKGEGPDLEESVHLRDAVNRGSVTVALSSTHYAETWNRGNWESRWALARLIWDTTRLIALPPMHKLTHGEIADALRLFGVDAPGALAGDVGIGRGVNFAYGSSTGRLIHVDDDGQERPWSELPDVVRQVHGLGATYEWLSLAGMPFDMRADGLEVSSRPAGLRFAARESSLARALGGRRGADRGRPLVVDALRGIEEEIAEVCLASNVDSRAFLLWLFEDDQQRARQFLDGMTSYGTYQHLRRLRHDNPQKKWEGNDRQDLLGLAVALTSCDVVVTEKYWSHVAGRLGFDRDGPPRIYNSLKAALEGVC